MLNPWVRGDGVGYYAFARAPLIQHNLDFTRDYQEANTSFRENRLDKNGQPTAEFRTRTGHLENHFTVGPAILWAPFLVATHVGVLLARSMGSAVSADGFSTPYRIAMALATAFYGFLGLLISFRIARKYVDETWALLATLGIWWASSLPVYMYFNPSWSHAHSAFVVALFLWYWHETRDARSLPQWILLGALAGLMLDVYYANVMLFVILPFEAVREYAAPLKAARVDTAILGCTHYPLIRPVWESPGSNRSRYPDNSQRWRTCGPPLAARARPSGDSAREPPGSIPVTKVGEGPVDRFQVVR